MFEIRPDSSQPLYEQIITAVKTALFNGSLSPGEKLPSVRELAEFTRVNPNTISKAYSLLEKENLIVTQKGRGSFICQTLDREPNQKLISQSKEQLKKILIDLYHLGLDQKSVVAMIQSLYEQIGKEADHA